ncbi:MAG: SMI1/KNR4 family protein [Bacteroidota bacterium]
MKHLIKDIRQELELISPEHLKITKKKYATKQEIAEFEKESGLVFPDDLKEFWTTCDFEITASTDIYKDLDCDMGPSFFTFDELEYLVPYWEENAGHDFDEEFSSGAYFHFKNRGYKENILIDKVFDKAWFPIAVDSFDGSICIDLNPGQNGTYGQLLYMMYIGDSKSGPYYTGFKSLKAFLEYHLHILKTRKIEVEEKIVYPLTHF